MHNILWRVYLRQEKMVDLFEWRRDMTCQLGHILYHVGIYIIKWDATLGFQRNDVALFHIFVDTLSYYILDRYNRWGTFCASYVTAYIIIRNANPKHRSGYTESTKLTAVQGCKMGPNIQSGIKIHNMNCIPAYNYSNLYSVPKDSHCFFLLL